MKMKMRHVPRNIPTKFKMWIMIVMIMMMATVILQRHVHHGDDTTTGTSTTGTTTTTTTTLLFVESFKRTSILSKQKQLSSSSSLSDRNNNNKENIIPGPQRRATIPTPVTTTPTVSSSIVSTSVSLPNRQHNNNNNNNNDPQQYYSKHHHHHNIQQALTNVQWYTFMIMMSGSMVALVPVQATLQLFSNDQSRTTQYLSVLTTVAALIELTCSQSIGSLLDRMGRKIVLLIIVGVVALLHTMTAIVQPMNRMTIALQKCIGTITIGFFMITIQTIITDLVLLSSNNSSTSNHKNQSNMNLSSVMGQQMAVTGIGFLFGIATAGIVSKYCISYHYNYNVMIYSIAAILAIFAYVLIQFQFYETYDYTTTSSYRRDTVVADVGARDAAKTSQTTTWIASTKSLLMKVCNSLLSCTNLLTKYGIKIRILSILLLIMTLPMYMGDLFQIYAKTEWNLSTSMFSTYLSLFAITGILSNVVGSMLIKSMGIRTFTQIAILSKMIPSLFTILFGYRGSMIGIMVGFLGNAQSIGIIAALISQSTAMMTTTTTTNVNTTTTTSRSMTRRTHPKQPLHSSSSSSTATSASDTMKLPSSMSPSQGVMAGERASLMALLKVIGPILYSTLYIQGRQYFHTSTVPFIFNIMLSIIALIITSHYL